MRFSVLVLLFVVGCNDDICSRHTDCAANQMCSIEGKCVGAAESTSDAGTGDGSTTDGGTDAGADAQVDGGME